MGIFSGPTIEPLAPIGARTLGGFIPDVAHRYRDRVAIVFDDPLLERTTRWTYDDLGFSTRDIARALLMDGVQQGTHVGVLMGNRPEAVASVFGAATVGAIPVLVPASCDAHQIGELLRQSNVEVLLTQERLGDRSFPAEIAQLREHVPKITSVIAFGSKEWDFWISSANEVATDQKLGQRFMQISPRDDGLVQFPMTCSDPYYGIVHSQYGPALAFWIHGIAFGRSPEDKVACPSLPERCIDLHTTIGPTLAMGGTCVLHADPGLADLPLHVAPEPAFVGIELTETCGLFSGDLHGPNDANSLGQLLAGNELRVVEPETGIDCAVGVSGEFVLRGPSLMKRILGRTRKSSFDAQGFFATGTYGYVTETGRIFSSDVNAIPATKRSLTV